MMLRAGLVQHLHRSLEMKTRSLSNSCCSRQGGVSLYTVYHAASNFGHKTDRPPLLPGWLSLALLSPRSTSCSYVHLQLHSQDFRGLLALVWDLVTFLSPCVLARLMFSALLPFRNISLVNFVYDCGITEISNGKMYVLIKVLSAWTHPIRENYQYYLTLLCHTKWFASQLLKSIWILERVMVGRCGLTYSNRNVWGCCRFVPFFAKNKYISAHIWNF